jgi:hypothetical protein
VVFRGPNHLFVGRDGGESATYVKVDVSVAVLWHEVAINVVF